MKQNNIVLLMIAATLATAATLSCTNNQGSAKTVAPKKVSAAEIAEGKALVENADCLTCHKVDMKVIGPAFKDVAIKYPVSDSNYSLLTQKIINGGNGVWGEVAMSPHASLTPADVKKMVEYILTLQ